MKRNPRNNRYGASEGRNSELSDVNEQELAKAVWQDGVTAEEKSGDVASESVPKENDEGKIKKEPASEPDEAESEAELLREIFGEAAEADASAPTEAVVSVGDSTAIVCGNIKKSGEEPQGKKVNDGGDGRKPEAPRSPAAGRRRKGHGGFYVSVILICFAFSVGILLFVAGERASEPVTDSGAPEIDGTPSLSDKTDASAEPDVGELYTRGIRSSVTVAASTEGTVEYSSGTAVFADGYIATLYETVAGADSIAVALWDGSSYEAELAGFNKTVNIALLRIDRELQCVDVGSSALLGAGDRIYAIGTVEADGLGSSLLVGEISYAARTLELTAENGTKLRAETIQMSRLGDRAMRGCPVFNADGEAIGIALTAGTSSAVSFALPLDKAMPILEALKNGEEPSAEVLNMLAYALPRLGITGESGSVDGVYGVLVKGFANADCDAAKKLRAGDIIVALDGNAITDTQELRAATEMRSAGEQAEVFVIRQGQRLSFYVTLE